ncbi:MAG: tetratricopeptide repeat protein [Deltaproteobacteria bacterium]|nr:tetratricopeptide repeat protein [Deltaproteobacteria bacterium]
MVVALAMAAAPVRADRVSPPPPTAAEVGQLLAQDRISDAHRAAEALVAAHPEDARARFLLASALVALNRAEDALAQLDAGLAVATGEAAAHLHGLRANLAVLRGDAAMARQEVDLAFALLPGEELAGDVRRQLDLVERHAQRVAAPPPAGAAALVYRFFTMIEQGATASELAALIDLGILARSPPGVPRTQASLVGLVRAASDAFTARDGTRVLAWELAPGPTPTRVGVTLLVENVFSAARIDALRAMYADPRARALIEPETRAMFDGLDPGDREEAMRRMIGQHRQTLAAVTVEVVDDGAAMRIVDLTFNGVSVRDQWGPTISDATAVEAPPAAARSPILPVVLGVLAVAIVSLPWVLRRRRRRR